MFKCAGKHLTYNCLLEGKLENAKCFNFQSNHPASYKGCIVKKQLQQKLYPPLKQILLAFMAPQDTPLLKISPISALAAKMKLGKLY